MPDVTLRPASLDDLPTVLEFWRSAAENADRPVDTAAALESLLRRDPEALILAEAPTDAPTDAPIGVEVVGTVIAGWDGWRCHLYRLAVAPGRRRQGIGRLLIEAAERRFRAAGGIRADAMVLDDNDDARHAWAAGGYHRQDDWSRWVKPLA